MKILKNEWVRFVLWMTVLAAIYGAIKYKQISFNIRGLIACVFTGIGFGTIFYGIWYVVITKKKKSAQLSQSAGGIIKDNLKIIGFLVICLFLIKLIVRIAIILILAASGLTVENANNIRRAIIKEEQFVGITRSDVVKKFGKPGTFQTIGAVNKDGTFSRTEILTYPTWNWRIVIVLVNDVVAEVVYEKHPDAK